MVLQAYARNNVFDLLENKDRRVTDFPTPTMDQSVTASAVLCCSEPGTIKAARCANPVQTNFESHLFRVCINSDRLPEKRCGTVMISAHKTNLADPN